MNSPTVLQSPRSRSQIGCHRRSIIRPPINLHSDCPPEPEDSIDSSGLGQRSVSLTTLQAPVQPRMAQLETLEAKMASIEVSLSSTPRRKKNGSLGGLGASIRSIPKELAAKELETLRNALRDKENIIQSLKGQLTIPGLRLSSIRNNNNNNNNTNSNNNNNNNVNNCELTEVEKKQAEERLTRLKTDVDNKRLALKNLKMALERLDITDNIDVRIQQAELEYQLGREELNLLTLLEETRALQLCLEESNKNSTESHTLFSCVNGSGHVILLGMEVEYDPKSPKFGASQKDSMPGLWIDWALEETGMNKGDRLVEVNGKIVLTKSRDELSRLLAVAPDPAQIVILRKLNENVKNTITINPVTSKEVAALRSELEAVRDRAEEAQKSKDGLISDNIRLTHRISYLEEQVSELLCRKTKTEDMRVLAKTPVISTVKTNQNVTNINITSTQNGQKEVQVFQKGPQVTALVDARDSHTALPVRSKSSLSNVSNTHIPAPSPQPDYLCHKSHRHKHRSSRHNLQSSMSTQNLEQNEKITYRKHHNHHHHHREKDYSSETNSVIEPHVSRYNKRNVVENGRGSVDKASSEKEYNSDIMDQSFKKATKIVHELTRSNRVDTSNLYEKHRQKCLTASEKYNSDILKHYNARKSTSVLDFRSEIHIGAKYSPAVDSKSVEELIEKNGSNDPNKRVYKKISDSRSVKSLDFDSDCNSSSTTYRPSNGYAKSVDYTSEPIENNRKLSHFSGYYSESVKPRPTPPKKPIRLSLHKTQSLQSVENPSSTSAIIAHQKNIDANLRKRNYKGEIPLLKNGDDLTKWTQFNQMKKDNGIESGSWC